MPLKILCAGYSKDEKFEIEKRVRTIFSALAEQSWTISLVKLGGLASVTVDGPDERIRAKSFMADPAALQDPFANLLKNHGFDLPAPVEPAVPTPPPRPAPRAAAPPPRPAPSPKPLPAPPPKPAPAPSPVVVRPAAPPPARAEPTTQPSRMWIPEPPRVKHPPTGTAPSPAPPARPVAPPKAAPPPIPRPSPPTPAPTRGRNLGPAPSKLKVPVSRPAGPHRDARPAAPAFEPPPPPTPAARTQSMQDAHSCPSCSQRFVVHYEVHPGEPRQMVAVACPHCWKVDRVEVSESAALERAYRADKT